jgi:hypothetical protein
MKLRAQFVIDITVADFVEAAAHQKHLAVFLQKLKQQYGNATLTMRERRQPKLASRPKLVRQAAANTVLAVAE